METVRSSDGCRIAYERSGRGSPLVLVGGAFSTRETSAPAVAALDGDFAVYRYDRRGRGDSEDAAVYAPEREVEDLAAVIAAAGGDAFVFGQSSGAALSLETAATGALVRAVLANEPPYTGTEGSSYEMADRLAELVASGHPEQAAERFVRNTGAPDAVVEQTKAWEGWPGMVAIAHTLPYDVRLCNDGVVPVQRLAQISCPVLATAGGLSTAWAPAAAQTIAEAVPAGEWRLLDGVGHNLPVEVLAPLLREFFLG